MIAVAVHSLAIASQPVLVFGFLGLVRRLCWERPLVSGGMIVYSFGAVAGMCAAIASGFVAPLLTRQLLTAAGGERDLVQMALHYNGMVNQGFAKVFVVASFAAVLCWSASLLKVGEAARWIGITGCVIGAVSLLVFLSGHVRLNVHGFGLLVFVQSAWIILVGVWLIRRGD